MRELVDEGDLGVPRQDGVEVHLLEARAAVLDDAPRHDLEAGEHLRAVCGRPWVSTSATTTSVPRASAPVPLAEHGVRLAHAGGGAEVDAQPTAAHRPLSPLAP